MIARLKILLPFYFQVTKEELKHFDVAFDNCIVRFYAPMQSAISLAEIEQPNSRYSFDDIEQYLWPVTNPKTREGIKFDGQRLFDANLIQIDFLREKPFFKEKDKLNRENQDPSEQLINKVVLFYLNSIRSLNQASFIRLNNLNDAPRYIRYLNDDGTELIKNKDLVPGIFSYHMHIESGVINKGLWEDLSKIPPYYKPPLWEVLILDAIQMLPEHGTSIVLAFSALEVLINQSIKYFVKQLNLTDVKWEWVNNPNNKEIDEPYITDKFSNIFKLLTGKSLKDDNQLWEKFIRIKKLRNSFAHAGVLVIDGKEQDAEKIKQLVFNANEIIDWVEVFLPVGLKRIKLTNPGFIETDILIQPEQSIGKVLEVKHTIGKDKPVVEKISLNNLK